MVRVMLLVLLLASSLSGVLCVPVGNQHLAGSLKWSNESMDADLQTVEEQRSDRSFKTKDYIKCVISIETALLNVAVNGLSSAAKQVREGEEAHSTLIRLLEILDGNGRMVVGSSGSTSGLLSFKSRFSDVLSMSLGFPGDKNFAKIVEGVRRKEPKTSDALWKIEKIPTRMLEDFYKFVARCASDIRNWNAPGSHRQ